MKTLITSFFVCMTMIFGVAEANAQCCGVNVDISPDGFVTVSNTGNLTIFKVWDGGRELTPPLEFNVYANNPIPPVINSIGANGQPIAISCQGGNFWLDIQCGSVNCTFNLSQAYCKTSKISTIENIDIYPNPAINFVNVELPFIEEEYVINVLDLSGRIVETISSNGGQMMLSTENLNSGLYMLHVRSETTNYAQKIQVLR